MKSLPWVTIKLIMYITIIIVLHPDCFEIHSFGKGVCLLYHLQILGSKILIAKKKVLTSGIPEIQKIYLKLSAFSKITVVKFYVHISPIFSCQVTFYNTISKCTCPVMQAGACCIHSCVAY